MVAEDKLLETMGRLVRKIPLVRKILENPIGEEEETQGEDLEEDHQDLQDVTYVTNHDTWHLSVLKKAKNLTDRRENLVREEDSQEEENQGSYVAPEKGESLMMRRTLLNAPITHEPPQRKNLFRTTYKCREKVCRMMIDSGSTDNLVSEEVVKKLKLRRVPHPNPYKVSWLTKK